MVDGAQRARQDLIKLDSLHAADRIGIDLAIVLDEGIPCKQDDSIKDAGKSLSMSLYLTTAPYRGPKSRTCLQQG